MTYVVTENCDGCKFTDCVEVCPVDCFYDAGQFLVIDPEECIDCSACVPECPVQAIFPDDELPEDQAPWLQTNTVEAARLKDFGAKPITAAQEPLPTAAEKKARLGL